MAKMRRAMTKPILTKPSRRLAKSYTACLERMAPGLISEKRKKMAEVSCTKCRFLTHIPFCTKVEDWVDKPQERYECSIFEPRETPLLVDELAKALKEVTERLDAMDHYHGDGHRWTEQESVQVGEAALARYQRGGGRCLENCCST